MSKDLLTIQEFSAKGHFDYCGANLSGRGRDIVMLAADYCGDSSSSLEIYENGPPHEIYYGTVYDTDDLLTEHNYHQKGSGAFDKDLRRDSPGVRTLSTF